MGIGKGGSSQSANQQQSGSQAGTSNLDTLGGSYNSQTSTPNVTSGFTGADKTLQGLLGPSGLNQDQQTATDSLKSYLQNPNNAVSQISAANSNLTPFTTAPAFQAGPTSTVSAPTGASGMAAYQNPYTDQVVNSTESDLTNAYNKVLNQNKMAAAAGGAFGGGRAGVTDAQSTDDFLRNLSSTDANLRNTGFNTAMQGGEFDAGNALTASGQNAANTQALNEFNTNQQQTAAQQQMAAIQAQANNAANENAIGTGDLQQVYNMAGGGNTNLLQYLQSQVPAFGQSTSGGSVNAGNTGGQTAGTSQGASSGSSSGKNGGITAG